MNVEFNEEKNTELFSAQNRNGDTKSSRLGGFLNSNGSISSGNLAHTILIFGAILCLAMAATITVKQFNTLNHSKINWKKYQTYNEKILRQQTVIETNDSKTIPKTQ